MPRNDFGWGRILGPGQLELQGEVYSGGFGGGSGFQAGDIVPVGYLQPATKRQPVILARPPKMREKRLMVVPTVIPMGLWTQSNGERHQNPLGKFIAFGLANLERTTQHWPVPTVNVVEAYENGARVFGLAKAVHASPDLPAIEHWVSAWPVKRNEEAAADYAIGAWGVASRNLLWQATFDTGDLWPLTRTRQNTAKFFYVQSTRWAHLLPDEGDAPRIFSARSEILKSTTELDKPCGHAAIVGSNLFLPYLNLSYTSTVRNNPDFILDDLQIHQSGAYDRLALWKQQLGANDDFTWQKEEEIDPKDLVDFCDPDRAILLPTRPTNSNNAAPAWSTQHAGWVTFVSGREHLAASEKLDQLAGFNWSTTVYGPGSGPSDPLGTSHVDRGRRIGYTLQVVGPSTRQLIASKVIEAETAPRKLDDICFDSAAAGGAGFESSGYIGGNWIRPNVTGVYDNLGVTIDWLFGSSGYAIESPYQYPDHALFSSVAPVLLPAPLPNRARVTSFLNCLTSAGPALANDGGGIVALEGGDRAFAAILEPYQVRYGGEHSLRPGTTSVANRAMSRLDDIEVFFDGMNYNVDGIGASQGMKTQYQPHWTNRMGYLWRTKLLKIDINASEILETDISQTIDGVAYTEEFVASGTVDSIEVWTNVWQLLVNDAKGVLLVLRDRFAEYEAGVRSGSPSPHLEVYDFNAQPMTLLATVPLGSTDLLDSTFDSNRVAGDRLWNAYAMRPPRMKAVAKTLDFAQDFRVNVAVWERKELANPETESGFTRATYHHINLDDPSDPQVSTQVRTSNDVGAGSSGSPLTDMPLWEDWDSLIMDGGTMAWAKDSKLRETV